MKIPARKNCITTKIHKSMYIDTFWVPQISNVRIQHLWTTKKLVNSQHTLTNLKGYFVVNQNGLKR